MYSRRDDGIHPYRASRNVMVSDTIASINTNDYLSSTAGMDSSLKKRFRPKLQDSSRPNPSDAGQVLTKE
ncbi:unnamed protein product [Phytophthora fragariaefolia]|uniref:Unnamed protein product n=1 Tax=Phytophthora fragariaefolia TaxID=1490495 RepID=A0A9W7D5D5_9STRA|nr:unnamed protein product [Phytophthora fragariaefolia]